MNSHSSKSILLGALLLSATAFATDSNGPRLFKTSRQVVAARQASTDTIKTYQTDHFVIAYTTTGTHAVAQAGLGLDGKGVPVVIDSLGKLAEQVWRLAIDTMGYTAPPGLDTVLGLCAKVPSGKFPIEVADLVTLNSSFRGQSYMGYATTPDVDPAGKGRMELLVENDFVDGGTSKAIRTIVDPINNNGDSVLYDYSKDPLKGWAVALAHEFYHNLQYEYDYQYTYAFHEMTAVWFPTRAFPNIHHEWQYFPRFIKHIIQPAFRSDSTYPYDNYVFISELAHVYGDSVLRQLWSLHASDFNSDEAIWFHRSIAKLGLNELLFTTDYLRGILSIAVNAAHYMNGDDAISISSIKSEYMTATSRLLKFSRRSCCEMTEFVVN